MSSDLKLEELKELKGIGIDSYHDDPEVKNLKSLFHFLFESAVLDENAPLDNVFYHGLEVDILREWSCGVLLRERLEDFVF